MKFLKNKPKATKLLEANWSFGRSLIGLNEVSINFSHAHTHTHTHTHANTRWHIHIIYTLIPIGSSIRKPRKSVTSQIRSSSTKWYEEIFSHQTSQLPIQSSTRQSSLNHDLANCTAHKYTHALSPTNALQQRLSSPPSLPSSLGSYKSDVLLHRHLKILLHSRFFSFTRNCLRKRSTTSRAAAQISSDNCANQSVDGKNSTTSRQIIILCEIDFQRLIINVTRGSQS